MDPTTLVAFLFKAPPETRAIELFGSWDNFAQPYAMHHDRRRGKGSWTGCFRFENIIFDGDSSQWTKPRSGGLKQGGTYWYYYRLDDDFETYDEVLEHTSSCPLLPGQVVNVMEVPTEIMEPPSRCRSAGYWEELKGTLSRFPAHSRQQTLEPSDKYALLEAPPISKVHDRCNSGFPLEGRWVRGMPSLEPLFTSLPGTPDGRIESYASLEPGEPLLEPVRASPPQSDIRNSELSSFVDAHARHPKETHPNPLQSSPMPLNRLSHQGRVNYAGVDFDLVGPAKSSFPENDVSSPCFSADTSNSNDDLLTPYRLSGGLAPHVTSPERVHINAHQQALDHITDRLQALDTSPSSPEHGAQWRERARPVFTGYALPEPEANASVHSLSKRLSSTLTTEEPAGFYPHTLPLPVFAEESEDGGRSMVDDFLSELGYLGGSIIS
ncbi:hypothetical protein LTR08_000120 [Meristemomyces frigidus]|nr:hypothetical protein LTR08_000120 [Meristemomyces frigidus]